MILKKFILGIILFFTASVFADATQEDDEAFLESQKLQPGDVSTYAHFPENPFNSKWKHISNIINIMA